MAKSTFKKQDLTLEQFVKAEKRAKCRVCKFPIEVRSQIGRSASEKKISQDQQIKWIELITGQKITIEELKQHVSGRHDA
jgi:hypothetical protein